jgi:NAD(P)-dependent dehydrogenase (short-subunit alcohol dehydrogenase family)
MSLKRFDGKVVVISGGGTGIGKACAKAFAKEGAIVVIAGEIDKPLKDTVNEINSEGGRAEYITTDISYSDQVNKLIDTVMDKHGKLDIYVANAAVGMARQITETSDDDVHKLVDVNVKGTYFQLRKATEIMKKQGYGNIVAMSSISGDVGHADMTLYCSTKAAITNLVRALALELATCNIRVNAVCPGTIDAPMSRQGEPITSPRVKSIIEEEPMKRLGLPSEVAAVVLFLASEDASFVTGSAYTVDGGYEAG